MPLSDAELFDFNAALMCDYDDEEAHATLAEHGDAFRYQLTAALHPDEWAQRLEDEPPAIMDAIEVRGSVTALRNVAALIRQGEYLPGGTSYETVQNRQ